MWVMMGAWFLAFFGGLFGGSGGVWESSLVCVVVRVLLRVDVVSEGEAFCGLGLGIGCVLWLRRLRGVRYALLLEVVRLCIRLVTYSSSFPVITYFRWDRESNFA